MDCGSHDHRHGERGFALVLVLAIISTLTILGIGVLTSTSMNTALSRNYERATQARNMAEIGVRLAYREFINAGFLKWTSIDSLVDEDTGRTERFPETGNSTLLTTDLSGCYQVSGSDGRYRWEWNPGDPEEDRIIPTDKPHGFIFRVYFVYRDDPLVEPPMFNIEGEGWYDNLTKRVRATGGVETMFQFSYFSARTLGEFTRGASQTIFGKVHSNEDMFIRPEGSTLNVRTDAFTSSGFMIRSRDAWGRPDQSGAIFITENDASGSLVEMDPGSPRGSEGVAFDSFNPNWTNKTLGARAVWGGVVRDKVPYKSPPPIANLDPGEYYDIEADLHVDSGTWSSKSWCSRVTFWNWNEQRNETVMDIDVQALRASGDWPANGLVYCSAPTRWSNSDELDNRLLIASCRHIYTKGDFNTTNKKGAAIMTKHRVYHLSDNWDDAQSTNSKNRAAQDTRINAAIVDGAPTIDEYNWADRDGDHRYDWSGIKIYDDWDIKTAAGFNWPNNSGDPWANCDDLLENWGGRILHKYGSVVHLCGSEMCPNLNNSGLQPDELAWVQRTGYRPPTRRYEYDPDLADPMKQPPFTPLIAHISSWAPY